MRLCWFPPAGRGADPYAATAAFCRSRLKLIMALTDEQQQRIREEEIERIRVRNELTQGTQRQSAYKMFIFWSVLIAAAVLLWSVVRSAHSH